MKLKDLIEDIKKTVDSVYTSRIEIESAWDELDRKLYKLEEELAELFEAIQKKEEEEKIK